MLRVNFRVFIKKSISLIFRHEGSAYLSHKFNFPTLYNIDGERETKVFFSIGIYN